MEKKKKEEEEKKKKKERERKKISGRNTEKRMPPLPPLHPLPSSIPLPSSLRPRAERSGSRTRSSHEEEKLQELRENLLEF